MSHAPSLFANEATAGNEGAEHTTVTPEHQLVDDEDEETGYQVIRNKKDEVRDWILQAGRWQTEWEVNDEEETEADDF